MPTLERGWHFMKLQVTKKIKTTSNMVLKLIQTSIKNIHKFIKYKGNKIFTKIGSVWKLPKRIAIMFYDSHMCCILFFICKKSINVSQKKPLSLSFILNNFILRIHVWVVSPTSASNELNEG